MKRSSARRLAHALTVILTVAVAACGASNNGQGVARGLDPIRALDSARRAEEAIERVSAVEETFPDRPKTCLSESCDEVFRRKTKVYDRCLNEGDAGRGAPYAMNACAAAEIHRQNRRLAVSYRQALNRASSRQARNAIVKAQARWRAELKNCSPDKYGRINADECHIHARIVRRIELGG
jgi:uncharacterized protein YecT (DUF1311 family)